MLSYFDMAAVENNSPKELRDDKVEISELSILTLDSDTNWLSQFSKKIQDSVHTLTAVSDISEARMAMKRNRFDAFILNLFVGNQNTVELIQEIKTNNPTCKIIFVLDSDTLITEGHVRAEDLVMVGASDIFIKPFDSKDLLIGLGTVSGIVDLVNDDPNFAIDEGIEFERKDINFTRIPLIHFIPNQAVLFNTYVRLGQDRYVKILGRGDSFTKDFLKRYVHQKKIDYFYFAIQDRVAYINHCNKFIKILSRVQKDHEGRLVILDSAVEKYLEEVYSKGISEDTVELGKSVVDGLGRTIQKNQSLKTLLDDLNQLDPSIVDHSFLVAFLSTMIASQFDWYTPLTSETLGMACIFHDLGKTKMPANVAKKSVFLMSPAELESYHNHPIWGAEIISKNPYINPTVPHVILQHHEAQDGTGFPYGFPGAKCLALSRIVFFADLLAHLMCDKKIDSIEALNLLLKDSVVTEKINQEVLEKFCAICVTEVDLGIS